MTDEFTARRLGISQADAERWVRLARVPQSRLTAECQRMTAAGIEITDERIDQFVRGYIAALDEMSSRTEVPE